MNKEGADRGLLSLRDGAAHAGILWPGNCLAWESLRFLVEIGLILPVLILKTMREREKRRRFVASWQEQVMLLWRFAL